METRVHDQSLEQQDGAPSFSIEFEASGIAPDSYPVEVAGVSSDTSFSSLIKPAH
jgi:hypothetical protein